QFGKNCGQGCGEWVFAGLNHFTIVRLATCWQWQACDVFIHCVSVSIQGSRNHGMSKAKVFATHSLFDEARSLLEANCEMEYWGKPERPPREEVLQRVRD